MRPIFSPFQTFLMSFLSLHLFDVIWRHSLLTLYCWKHYASTLEGRFGVRLWTAQKKIRELGPNVVNVWALISGTVSDPETIYRPLTLCFRCNYKVRSYFYDVASKFVILIRVGMPHWNHISLMYDLILLAISDKVLIMPEQRRNIYDIIFFTENPPGPLNMATSKPDLHELSSLFRELFLLGHLRCSCFRRCVLFTI